MCRDEADGLADVDNGQVEAIDARAGDDPNEEVVTGLFAHLIVLLTGLFAPGFSSEEGEVDLLFVVFQ